ncbi:HAD family hydrolase [Corynebacterium durum]|uniref:HAD hydrolase, family IA, variant 3 n=1 Tax=Corynebacterium durum F0235 TaxID=1035195 RepID=L1MI90_9CORY|nr:HAD family phosphatase [Corynebacterium durum]EKX90646.1 HAD hydrolase, family IA, variant 3 [Corynebacterium durum F0235]
MLKAILWDMDGTLVDSEPLWGIVADEMSEKMGRKLTPELHEKIIGVTFEKTVTICANHAGITLTDDIFRHYYDITLERVAELFQQKLAPNPGVRELLTELSQQGMPMMVATNTVRKLADMAINAVGRDFFTATICGDEVEHGKPAPDMYLAAARMLGVDAKDCLVFEDSIAGMKAAYTAGCSVIGLPEAGIYPPEGITTLQQLHGCNSFDGVTATDVHQWFNTHPSKHVEEWHK